MVSESQARSKELKWESNGSNTSIKGAGELAMKEAIMSASVVCLTPELRLMDRKTFCHVLIKAASD